MVRILAASEPAAYDRHDKQRRDRQGDQELCWQAATHRFKMPRPGVHRQKLVS